MSTSLHRRDQDEIKEARKRKKPSVSLLLFLHCPKKWRERERNTEKERLTKQTGNEEK